ncbi:MAG: hypothetical protein MK106_14930 [Mariniblastus sp.]|nr:hypothetical protein [Mariniblastus sp.]
MARFKTTDDDQGAMDSLLDTMTNVVGILVIVLVVTQLGVGDAVQRIGKTLQIDPAELAEKKAEVRRLREQHTLLEADLQVSLNRDEETLDTELKRLVQEIDENTLTLKNLQQKNRLAELEKAKSKKEELEESKRRKALEDSIRTAMTEVGTLRAKLDQTPEQVVVPAKELRLPNPRPAAQGAQAVSLICTKGRIYPLSFGEIQKAARARSEPLLRTRRKTLYKEPGKGIDPDAFVDAFSRVAFRNEFYNVRMRAGSDGWPKLVLEPRETAGIREKLLTNKSSKFQKDLRGLDPNKYYLRFFVTSDSFETYLIARSVAQSYGFSAGWIPQNPDWRFVGNMGGDIRLGPPRPKPPPSPQPAKPPQKGNDID